MKRKKGGGEVGGGSSSALYDKVYLSACFFNHLFDPTHVGFATFNNFTDG